MVRYYIKKLRQHAGNIMVETSGDKIRNGIADGFIDMARALEKLDAPIEKAVEKKCFWCAVIGGFIGASIILIAILIVR